MLNMCEHLLSLIVIVSNRGVDELQSGYFNTCYNTRFVKIILYSSAVINSCLESYIFLIILSHSLFHCFPVSF